jgi:hypothetical protein
MNHSASALAAQRRRIGHVCPVCGKSFTALKTAVYCGNPCRQKAKYHRGKSGSGCGERVSATAPTTAARPDKGSARG